MKNMIEQLRKEHQWTQTELAQRLGWSQEDVSRAETGKTPLTERKIRKLIEVFKVKSSVLLGETDDSGLQPKIARSIGDISFGPEMVPILGHVNGSGEAIILNFDEPIGEAQIHPNQKNVKGGFALYAVGESMSPRYNQGELVYAVAKKQPMPGQDCIIELEGGESFIKKFLRATDKEIICKQLNPEKEWKRDRLKVKAIHAIVGRG